MKRTSFGPNSNDPSPQKRKSLGAPVSKVSPLTVKLLHRGPEKISQDNRNGKRVVYSAIDKKGDEHIITFYNNCWKEARIKEGAVVTLVNYYKAETEVTIISKEGEKLIQPICVENRGSVTGSSQVIPFSHENTVKLDIVKQLRKYDLEKRVFTCDVKVLHELPEKNAKDRNNRKWFMFADDTFALEAGFFPASLPPEGLTVGKVYRIVNGQFWMNNSCPNELQISSHWALSFHLSSKVFTNVATGPEERKLRGIIEAIGKFEPDISCAQCLSSDVYIREHKDIELLKCQKCGKTAKLEHKKYTCEITLVTNEGKFDLKLNDEILPTLLGDEYVQIATGGEEGEGDALIKVMDKQYLVALANKFEVAHIEEISTEVSNDEESNHENEHDNETENDPSYEDGNVRDLPLDEESDNENNQ